MKVDQITPVLNVSDIVATFAWFESWGWTKRWEMGTPPFFGAVSAGSDLFVDDVDAVYRDCVAKGLDVTFPPTNMPWDVREMHVRHPDGHVFRIGTGIELE